MTFVFDGISAYDFDRGNVTFRVKHGQATEVWAVSEEALQDHFGSVGIGEASVLCFNENASQIVAVANQLRANRGANLVLSSADF